MPIAPISPVHASAAGSSSSGQPRSSLPAVQLPDAPKPVTPANAAVHLMRVPSSRVLEAFVLLQRAVGQQNRSEAAQALVSSQFAPLAEAPVPRAQPRVDLEA
jgi:hypothetical protein